MDGEIRKLDEFNPPGGEAMKDYGLWLLVLGGVAFLCVSVIVGVFYGVLSGIWMFRAMKRLKEVDRKQWEEFSGGILPWPHFFKRYRFLYKTEDPADEELNRCKALARRYDRRKNIFLIVLDILGAL